MKLNFSNSKMLAFAVCVGLFSCYTGGDTITKASVFPKAVERAKKDKRHFIMYSGIDTFAVTTVEVENRQEFTVHLDKMDSLHKTALNNPTTISEKRAYL